MQSQARLQRAIQQRGSENFNGLRGQEEKLRLTEAELRHYVKVKKEEVVTPPAQRPRLSTSHLSQLSLVVDTGGSYAGEDVLESFGKPQQKKK